MMLQCAFGILLIPATYANSNLVTCIPPSSSVVHSAILLKITENIEQTTPSYQSYLTWSKHRKTQVFERKDDNYTFLKFGDVFVSYVSLINNTHCMVHSPPSPSGTPVPELTFNDQEWTTNGILFYHDFPPYVLGTVSRCTKVTITGEISLTMANSRIISMA